MRLDHFSCRGDGERSSLHNQGVADISASFMFSHGQKDDEEFKSSSAPPSRSVLRRVSHNSVHLLRFDILGQLEIGYKLINEPEL